MTSRPLCRWHNGCSTCSTISACPRRTSLSAILSIWSACWSVPLNGSHRSCCRAQRVGRSPSRLSPPTRSGYWVTRGHPGRCACAWRRCRMPSSTGSKILRSFCGATRPLTAPRSWRVRCSVSSSGWMQRACRPFSVSGAGEVAGITYTAAGRGTPVLLLPLGLSSRQWEPVLPRLQAHHCTIVLGGPYLKPMEQLESRAEGGYARMALQLLDLAKPHASEALIEVGWARARCSAASCATQACPR